MTQLYMLLLGVTTMSLLTTPFVIMVAVRLLVRDGSHTLYIAGPRMRLGTAAGDDLGGGGGGGGGSGNNSSDWAIVLPDGGGALGSSGATALSRGNKEHRVAVHAVAPGGTEAASRPKRQQPRQPGA